MPLFQPTSNSQPGDALRWRDPGALLIALMLVGIGLFGLWRVFEWGGDANRSLISNLVYLPLSLVPVVLCWRTAARPHANQQIRLAWLMLTAAAACELLGNLVWVYLENGLGFEPYPSIADLLFLGFYVFALAGMLLFPTRRGTRGTRLAIWLDVLTVVVGGGMLLWYFVLRPTALAANSDLFTRVISIAYPVGSLTLIFGAALLVPTWRRGQVLNGLILIGISSFARFIGDLIYGFQVLQGNYVSGSWVDLFWFTGYLFLALGALVEYRAPALAIPPEPAARAQRLVAPLSYIAIAAGYSILLFVAWQYFGTPLGDLLLGAVGLTLLVVSRQIVTVRENTRLLAESASRSSEARFRALVQEASDLIILADGQGCIQYLTTSVEQELGYAADELLGRPIFDLVHPDDAAPVRALLEQAAEPAALPGPVPWRLQNRDGFWLEFEMVARDMRQHSDVNGIVFTSRSTSERKARELAETASKAKSIFLAQMSHELRTPLTVILGYTELLQLQAPISQSMTLSVDLAKIKISAQHLLGLINDVLDFSKVEAGKLSITPQRLDLRDLLDDLQTTVQPLVAQNGNALEVDCAPDAIAITADPLRVRQILLNLLSNAAKFTEQGLIRLAVQAEPPSAPGADDWIIFTVTDTGVGIDAEDLAQLFVPFTQLRNIAQRPVGGTGLGLALSQKLCELMGGSISLSSQVGKGTAVTVRLPRHSVGELADEHEQDDDQQAMPREAIGQPFMPAVLALAITADATISDQLERVLPSPTLSLVTAASAAEGLQLASELAPNVLLIDAHSLGDAAGELLAGLRADIELAHIPQLLLAQADAPAVGASLAAVTGTLSGLGRPPELLAIEDEAPVRDLIVRVARPQGWQVLEGRADQHALDGVLHRHIDLVILSLISPATEELQLFEQLQRRDSAATPPVLVLISAGDAAQPAEIGTALRRLQILLEQVVVE